MLGFGGRVHRCLSDSTAKPAIQPAAAPEGAQRSEERPSRRFFESAAAARKARRAGEKSGGLPLRPLAADLRSVDKGQTMRTGTRRGRSCDRENIIESQIPPEEEEPEPKRHKRWKRRGRHPKHKGSELNMGLIKSHRGREARHSRKPGGDTAGERAYVKPPIISKGACHRFWKSGISRIQEKARHKVPKTAAEAGSGRGYGPRH
jgi:hypothetical protein